MARSLTQREDWTRDLGGCLTAWWRNKIQNAKPNNSQHNVTSKLKSWDFA